MNQAVSFEEKIEAHYAPRNLGDAILAALEAAGKDLDHLSLDDLAPLDEFHVRGRQATIELAQQLHLRPELRVLDVGSGLGGASRYLAATYGCHVTGLDLTEAYCQAAQMLAQRSGMDSLVTYRHGSALQMPFHPDEFDIVWTQHAAMNIRDKPRLYHEIYRVLKPGGRLALYDILAGPGGPVHFPVPWARRLELSFLSSTEELRALLSETGFRILSWRDVTEAGRVFFNQFADRIRQQGPAPLGFQVFLGQDFSAMIENTARNLDEQRIVLAMVVAQKVELNG